MNRATIRDFVTMFTVAIKQRSAFVTQAKRARALLLYRFPIELSFHRSMEEKQAEGKEISFRRASLPSGKKPFAKDVGNARFHDILERARYKSTARFSPTSG